MSPIPPVEGPARSAAELNELIRALFTHRDARLTDEQRAEYQRLLAELREVERRDVVKAA